jgi:hypothetical protein
LELAVRGDPAVAHGSAAARDALNQIDPKLPSAVLRCAFNGVIRPRIRYYDPQPDDGARRVDAVARAKRAVDSEFASLCGKADEPQWPLFPEAHARPREKLYITPRELPEEPKPVKLVEPIYVDHQAAAVWLSLFTPGDGTRIDWMPDVVETYSSWTAEANGAALDNCPEVDNPPREWNSIYWRLVARCVALWDDATLNRFCLHPLTSQPDEAFLNAMSGFLRSLDFLYLTGKVPITERAVAIRAALVQHFRTTRQFKQLASHDDHFIELHIGEALQAIFFNSAAFRGRPECYVPQEDVRKLFPFIPILEALAIDGASLGAAIVATALLDAVVLPEFSSFGIALAEAWMAHFPDDTVFWIDNGIGKRWCEWLKGLYAVSPTTFAPDTPLRRATDRILSDMVRVGVAEANQLEVTLCA